MIESFLKIILAPLVFVLGLAGYQLPTAQENLGASLPQAVAVFETSLASPISSSATSLTLSSNEIRGGGALSGYNCFTVDEGSPQAETLCGTVSGTAVTSLQRGISQATGTTTVAALQFAHRRGANVKITDFPIIQILKAQNNGEDTFANTLHYSTGVTCLAAADICNKGYVDTIVNQGAATSTETNGGIVELGTLAEQASSFDGGANKPTVLQTKNSTSTCQVLGAYNIVASSTSGKLDKNCFDQSSNYAFTGQNSFAASTTFAATTTIKGSDVNTSPLIINGVAYGYPSSNPTSTSTLTNYGTGALSWASPDWSVLASTTLGSAQASTTVSFPARTDLKVIIQAYAINGASNCGFINFNGDNGANYGYALSDLNGTTVTSITGDTRTVIKVNTNANANNQSMSVVLDISNPSSFKKFISFKTLTEPGGSAQGPNSVTGQALWNNTSSQITSITFGTGGCSVNGAFTHAAGSRITVYGSNN